MFRFAFALLTILAFEGGKRGGRVGVADSFSVGFNVGFSTLSRCNAKLIRTAPLCAREIGDEDNDDDDDGDNEVISFSSLPISDSERSEILANQPSKGDLLKDMLGINAFTVLLVVLIAGFLTANTILGPGWLSGMNDIREYGEGVPGDLVDLSTERYLLF